MALVTDKNPQRSERDFITRVLSKRSY